MSALIFITTSLAFIMGFIVFYAKYEVMNLENYYLSLQKQIHSHQESIKILKAEWAHLNDPKRLQELALKYLNVNPIKNYQFISIKDIISKDVAGEEKNSDISVLEDLVAQLASQISSDEGD